MFGENSYDLWKSLVSGEKKIVNPQQVISFNILNNPKTS